MLFVFQRLYVQPHAKGESLRALLCVLLALTFTKFIRVSVDHWAQDQKIVPLLVFDLSLAVAISCVLWLFLFW